MKSKLMFFVCLSLLVACSNDSKPTEKKHAETKIQPIPSSEEETVVQNEVIDHNSNPASEIPFEAIYGLYVGAFDALIFKENKRPSYSNKITISIDSIANKIIYGHSVVAGNYRPFQGSYIWAELPYIEVKEPGDDRYDGKFEFTAYPIQKKIIGNWFANDSNLAVTERVFDLEKRSFQYNPNLDLPEDVAWGGELYNTYDRKINKGEMLTVDLLKLNTSKSILKKEDIENMYKGDLEVLRNSIYARHGYSFKNRRMRYIFDNNVDWYMPIKTNILADLTELEKKNIKLLKRYENHAEKYYDSFGR